MYSIHLTNQIGPRTLSANHASAFKLKNALISAVSCLLRHLCNPPPILHPVATFFSPESTPPAVISPGFFFLYHHHQCLDFIGGFPILCTASSPPNIISLATKDFLILLCTRGNTSSCSLSVSPDWTAPSWRKGRWICPIPLYLFLVGGWKCSSSKSEKQHKP